METLIDEEKKAKQGKNRAVKQKKEEARKRRDAKQAEAEQNKLIRRRKPKKCHLTGTK